MSAADSEATRPLRVMVCPHELVTGGSQINAIDLAAGLRNRGHDVEVFAPVGPLVSLIERHGLTHVAGRPRRHPLGAWPVFPLLREIRRFQPDIVHTYEAPPSMASAFASAAQPHRNVTTVLSMSIPDYLPRDTPLIVGTQSLAATVAGRRGSVYVMEPPIDVDHDRPGDRLAARRRLGVACEQLVFAVVGRLSAEHEKARGIVQAISALEVLSRQQPVTLLVAGDGDEGADVAAATAAAEARQPSLDIRLLGDVRDPRDVYDAADVVFGMGGSALRAMSHAKPVIVQGLAGYWRPVLPDTLDEFQQHGYFGDGGGGAADFAAIARGLIEDAHRREELGAFGRRIVSERYGIESAVECVERIYLDELARRSATGPRTRALAQAAFRYVKFRAAVGFPTARRVLRAATGRSAAYAATLPRGGERD